MLPGLRSLLAVVFLGTAFVYIVNRALLFGAYNEVLKLLHPYLSKGDYVIVYPGAPPPPSTFNQTSVYVHHPDSDSSRLYNTQSNHGWLLETTKLRNNSYAIQPYVANGYIGVRLPVQGHGLAFDVNYTVVGEPVINGWPLYNQRFTGAFLAGFYNNQVRTPERNHDELLQRGSESSMASLPVWSTLDVTDPKTHHRYAAGDSIDKTLVSSYYQALSLRDGLVHTNVSWNGFLLNYTVMAHRSNPNLGVVRLEITSLDHDREVEIEDVLDGSGSVRTWPHNASSDNNAHSIHVSVTPERIPNIEAHEHSTLVFDESTSKLLHYSSQTSVEEKTALQRLKLQLKAGQTTTIHKYVGIASTDAFVDPGAQARKVSEEATIHGWEAVSRTNAQAWAQEWDSADIIVHQDPELQLSIRATIFHMLANMRKGDEGPGLGDNSVPVSGISSDSYGGMVFWDADLWMSLGMQAMFPDYAKSINNFRGKLQHQALENAQSYDYKGALYPWTSGRYGNCTATGPCVDYEYHLNIDIALSHWNYYLSTLDRDWLESTGYPIMAGAVDFFVDYLRQDPATNQYHSRNLTDPDEYADFVNDGAYTNTGISQLMRWATAAANVLGYDADPKWLDIANNMHIPFHAETDITLEFEGMPADITVKQADVVMIPYPLQYPLSHQRALNDLHFYAGCQSPKGPAMTYAIFAIDVAALAPGGCSAYTYLLYASQPYMRLPFYQFSEQLNDDPFITGVNPAFPFLTGHGGYLQVFTHGLTGFRAHQDYLVLDPMLPEQMSRGYTIKGFKYQGSSYDIALTKLGTTITRKSTFSDRAPEIQHIQIGSRNSAAGNYTLRVGESITVGTFQPTLSESNLAQCKPVISLEPWAPGHFPLSMNDGDESTFWQPVSSNKTSSILDLGRLQNFSQVSFLWGQMPPKRVAIGLINDTLVANLKDLLANPSRELNIEWILHGDIGISNPWDSGADTLVFTPNDGNQSIWQFSQTFESQMVVIEIEGNHFSDEIGATVREVSFSL